MLSIYAEVNRKFDEMYRGEDDCNEYAEILSTMSQADQELWHDEAELAWGMRAQHGMRADFERIAERAIMERFAAEEAARAEPAA